MNTHAQVFDADNDGVADAVDRCPLTTDLNGPVPTESLCEGCLGDAQTIEGCNASDVLTCRPGPNSQDIKYGVKPANVEKFLARRAWARKCAIVDPPAPPEEVSGVASDTEAVTLEIAGGRVTLPAASLPPGMEVRLGASPVDVLAPDVIAENEIAVSPVYSLTFPDTVIPSSNLGISIDVPTGVAAGIYARMRVEGGALTEGLEDSGWIAIIGTYNSEAGTYTLPLAATAPAISLVVLQEPGFVPQPEGIAFAASVVPQDAPHKQGLWTEVDWPDLFLGLFGINRAEALEAPPSTALNAHGWVVVCNPNDFKHLTEAKPCDGTQLEATIALLQIYGIGLHEAAGTLSAKGFDEAALATVTLEELRDSSDVYAFWDPSGASTTNQTYFLARMTDLQKDGQLLQGWYVWASQILLFDYRETRAVEIHELFHAVQKAYKPDWLKTLWLGESTAAAVQSLPPGSPGKGKAFRYEDTWRNWELPLNNGGDSGASAGWARLAPYTVAELWLSADENLAQLDELIKDALPPSGTSYTQVSAQMQSANLPPIGSAFSTVIKERAQAGGYPHCGQLIDPENPAGPRTLVDPVECTETRCSLGDYLPLDLQPLTAFCYRPLVTFTDPLSCEAGETYTMFFEGETGRHDYYVDATLRQPNDELTSAPLAFELWVADSGTSDLDPVSDPPAVLIEKKCEEEQEPTLEIVRQIITSRAYAQAAGIGETVLDSPKNETRERYYFSFEDGSQPSFIDTLYKANAAVVEDTREFVPPLGTNSWTASTNATGEFLDSTLTPIFLSGTASSSVSAQSSVAPNAISATGSMETLAEASNENSLRIQAEANSAVSYTYRTRSMPAQLTIRWDCGLASLSVNTQNLTMAGGESTTYEKERDTWQCGEQTWIVPPEHEVSVVIRSFWNAAWSKLLSGDVQAPGGSFNLELTTAAVP